MADNVEFVGISSPALSKSGTWTHFIHESYVLEKQRSLIDMTRRQESQEKCEPTMTFSDTIHLLGLKIWDCKH